MCVQITNIKFRYPRTQILWSVSITSQWTYKKTSASCTKNRQYDNWMFAADMVIFWTHAAKTFLTEHVMFQITMQHSQQAFLTGTGKSSWTASAGCRTPTTNWIPHFVDSKSKENPEGTLAYKQNIKKTKGPGLQPHSHFASIQMCRVQHKSCTWQICVHFAIFRKYKKKSKFTHASDSQNIVNAVLHIQTFPWWHYMHACKDAFPEYHVHISHRSHMFRVTWRSGRIQRIIGKWTHQPNQWEEVISLYT